MPLSFGHRVYKKVMIKEIYLSIYNYLHNLKHTPPDNTMFLQSEYVIACSIKSHVLSKVLFCNLSALSANDNNSSSSIYLNYDDHNKQTCP